ncbi:hypothetical protein Tco_1195173 [Tanacetum coccineum]
MFFAGALAMNIQIASRRATSEGFFKILDLPLDEDAFATRRPCFSTTSPSLFKLNLINLSTMRAIIKALFGSGTIPIRQSINSLIRLRGLETIIPSVAADRKLFFSFDLWTVRNVEAPHSIRSELFPRAGLGTSPKLRSRRQQNKDILFKLNLDEDAEFGKLDLQCWLGIDWLAQAMADIPFTASKCGDLSKGLSTLASYPLFREGDLPQDWKTGLKVHYNYPWYGHASHKLDKLWLLLQVPDQRAIDNIMSLMHSETL